ncbi:hypothetical protein CDD82_6289 [Ophiocordyceps australis]|uniref:Uncharacterized protein n=1 Tax=Ophiocordyceps australis TaxID=1399860 RepID=A0A2C5YW74_9HYPO|nr:hypothetical protein CDD82_6289 [Ophiocordyceps australis]
MFKPMPLLVVLVLWALCTYHGAAIPPPVPPGIPRLGSLPTPPNSPPEFGTRRTGWTASGHPDQAPSAPSRALPPAGDSKMKAKIHLSPGLKGLASHASVSEGLNLLGDVPGTSEGAQRPATPAPRGPAVAALVKLEESKPSSLPGPRGPHPAAPRPPKMPKPPPPYRPRHQRKESDADKLFNLPKGPRGPEGAAFLKPDSPFYPGRAPQPPLLLSHLMPKPVRFRPRHHRHRSDEAKLLDTLKGPRGPSRSIDPIPEDLDEPPEPKKSEMEKQTASAKAKSDQGKSEPNDFESRKLLTSATPESHSPLREWASRPGIVTTKYEPPRSYIPLSSPSAEIMDHVGFSKFFHRPLVRPPTPPIPQAIKITDPNERFGLLDGRPIRYRVNGNNKVELVQYLGKGWAVHEKKLIRIWTAGGVDYIASFGKVQHVSIPKRLRDKMVPKPEMSGPVSTALRKVFGHKATADANFAEGRHLGRGYRLTKNGLSRHWKDIDGVLYDSQFGKLPNLPDPHVKGVAALDMAHVPEASSHSSYGFPTPSIKVTEHLTDKVKDAFKNVEAKIMTFRPGFPNGYESLKSSPF